MPSPITFMSLIRFEITHIYIWCEAVVNELLCIFVKIKWHQENERELTTE